VPGGAVGEWSVALALTAADDATARELAGFNLVVPRTPRISENIRLNIDAGYLRALNPGRDYFSYGVGIDIRTPDNVWTVTGEVFGVMAATREDDKRGELQPRWQLGLRWRHRRVQHRSDLRQEPAGRNRELDYAGDHGAVQRGAVGVQTGLGSTAAARRWRAMDRRDLAAVHALSMAVHPDHPERAEVLAEKLLLFPRGCFVLDGAGAVPGTVAGYCFSHPWTRGGTPALDTLLGAMPQNATTFFVHDLTLDAEVRGTGAGRAVVALLPEAARSLGLAHLSLVAVNNREPFWQAAGFVRVGDETMQAAARAKYGEGAVRMERVLEG